MKNKKMMDMLGLADEKFVSEADPSRKRVPKKRFNLTAILAAACCFLLILNLAIVIPVSIYNSDGSATGAGSTSGLGISSDPLAGTSGSDLNHIKNPQSTTGSSGENESPDAQEPPQGSVQFVKNTALISALDKYLNKNQSPTLDKDQAQEEIKDALDKEEGELELEEKLEDLGGKLENESSSVSPDINDNQVQNVSEGDIAKRSDKFLYYLRGDKLYVYSLKGTASAAECIFPLSSYVSQMNSYMKKVEDKKEELLDKYEELNKNTATLVREMFLSADFKTLTVILTNKSTSMTGIFVFDVSSSPAVILKSFNMLSGNYVSSRMINGELIVFTRYTVSKSYNEDEPSTYIPFYVTEKQEYFTNDIYFPSVLASSSYLTVTRLSHGGTVIEKSLSYLSFSDTLYVSSGNIFISRLIPLSQGKYNTELVGINYSEGGLTHSGSVTIPGTLKNQYSLDEHEGILRVVATTYFGEYSPVTPSYQSSSLRDEILEDAMDEIIEDVIDDSQSDPLTGSTAEARRDTSASLYCIDLSSWEIRATVANFAPKGEIVRSARFEGTNAYVCTSLQQVFIDPVFFFDLSDLDNITYTETAEMDGYSSSLINFGNGYVVGVGYGNSTSTLKIDVYKEIGTTVEVVCSYEFKSAKFSLSYKSYFVDRERHLLGIAMSSYVSKSSSYEDYYLLLYFNGSYFDFIINSPVDFTSASSVRSFLQDGFVYVVTDTTFTVFETGNLDNLPFAEKTPDFLEDTTGSTASVPGIGVVSVRKILNYDFSDIENNLGRTLTDEECLIIYDYIVLITSNQN